jgi:hypothetical protein
MDIHARIAACLHIATAVLILFVLLVLGAIVGAFGALGAGVGFDPRLTEWVGGLGVLFLVLLALLPLAELVGAVMLLRGSEVGRVLTIIFSVLSLVNIPIGTAIGIYSMWALLRTVPQDPAQPVPTPMPAGARLPS